MLPDLHLFVGLGHLGEKEHPSIEPIKLGGSPSMVSSFFFSPTTDGVDSKSNRV